MDRIGFGAAYYAEYQRRPDIDFAMMVEADFALMAEARFSVIRVGESVWSTWEPEDGRFELDWLEPVLDAANRHDIGVILGTPTYAVPMWLARRYPDIAAETASGHRVGWGARQEVNFAHAAYRFHAERVIRAVVGRYREHPAIIGYQVDNEPGPRLLYNTDVFEKFVDWLRRRYGTVDRLNEEWGLVYWSHRLSRWSDLWRPEGNFQPQYDLAWRRFQAELVTEFIGWQAGIVRELTGGRGFVTTCISYEQPGIEDAELSRALDVASGNAYYEMQDSLAHPGTLPRSSGPTGWVVRGPWAVTQLADLMYSSKQAPFLVTETNAGSIGFSSMNESPYDGQWRQVAWLLVARGARLIEYWQWNTLSFGAETYWGGVLPHSGIPGRAYREIARTGQELREAGGAFAAAEPDYDIAVLYDSDSKFALSTQGPLRGEALIDPDSYRHILTAFSRAIFDAKRQQRLVRPQHLLPSRGGEHDAADAAARYPVLIAAAFYTASDEDLDFLVAYAQAGGHLVVGPRTGYGDREGRARTERAPARITGAAGVWYDEMASLPSPVPAHGALRGAATGFAEGLVASGAEVLASYQHPHLGRWAAVTTKPAGAGRITVVGTVPDQDLAADLVRWLVPDAAGGWTADDSVTVSSSTDAAGTRLHVLHNWSWDEAKASPSSTVADMLRGRRHAPGEPVTLGPWDVRLFRSDETQDQDDEYRLGSLTHPDRSVRRKAIAHHAECVDVMRQTGSAELKLWLPDGTNYPGQDDLRARQDRLAESLQEIYALLDPQHRLLIEYKFFEPHFYAMDIPDWGTSLLHCLALGERAHVVLDTGHHAPGTNIEFIVMQLLRVGRLGAFDFNSRNYADDDLIVGSADPFQLFRIMNEIVAADALGPRSRVSFMLDQCHNIEPKIPGQIRSVMNVQEATAKALLIDRAALAAARQAGDVLGAHGALMDAYNTDVRPLLAELRTEQGLDLDPTAAYTASGYAEKIAAERVGGQQAGWGA